jgi:hypothetical protein
VNPTKSSTVASSGDQDTPVSGNTNQPKKCFANLHMTWAEHGFYTTCKSLANAGPTGFLYLNGPDLALLAKTNSTESSKRSSKTTVYKYAKALERLGFFVLKKASTKDDKGKNTSTVYSVLEHDQWAKLHPGECNKIQCQIREEKENHQDQLLNSPRPIIEPTITNSCPDQDQELVTIFIPTTHTEFTYKPLPTNPAPIIGNGTLDIETGNPSAEARASVPLASAPKEHWAKTSPQYLRWSGADGGYLDCHGNTVSIDRAAKLIQSQWGLVRDGDDFRQTRTGEVVPWKIAQPIISGKVTQEVEAA